MKNYRYFFLVICLSFCSKESPQSTTELNIVRKQIEVMRESNGSLVAEINRITDLGDASTLKAYTEKEGIYLGSVVSYSNTEIVILSPKNYFYRLSWAGQFMPSDLFYSKDFLNIKDNLYTLYWYYKPLKSFFRVRFPGTDIDSHTSFCSGETSIPYDSSIKYQASNSNSEYLTDYYLNEFSPPGPEGMSGVYVTQLLECTQETSGVQDSIEGPIIVKDSKGKIIIPGR